MFAVAAAALFSVFAGGLLDQVPEEQRRRRDGTDGR